MLSKNNRILNGLGNLLNVLVNTRKKVKDNDENSQTGNCENIPRLLPQIIHSY